MLEVSAIRACTRRFRYRVPLARRGGQEPPQAMEFLPWDALGPPGRGVPGGQALRYGTHAPAKCAELNVPCQSHKELQLANANNARLKKDMELLLDKVSAVLVEKVGSDGSPPKRASDSSLGGCCDV